MEMVAIAISQAAVGCPLILLEAQLGTAGRGRRRCMSTRLSSDDDIGASPLAPGASGVLHFHHHGRYAPGFGDV